MVQSPPALHATEPFALGPTQGVQSTELVQPVCTVLPTQIPPQRCSGGVHMGSMPPAPVVVLELLEDEDELLVALSPPVPIPPLPLVAPVLVDVASVASLMSSSTVPVAQATKHDAVATQLKQARPHRMDPTYPIVATGRKSSETQNSTPSAGEEQRGGDHEQPREAVRGVGMHGVAGVHGDRYRSLRGD